MATTTLKSRDIVNTISRFSGSKDDADFRDFVLACNDAKYMLPENLGKDFLHFLKTQLRGEASQIIRQGKPESISDLLKLLKGICSPTIKPYTD